MKPTISVAASFGALLVLGGAALAEMPKAVGEGEGEVNIVAWPGYIERGESDKNYDWVTAFEKETGCKVNVKTAATSDEMVTLMNQGGFDLVTASGDASLRLVAGKKVQPVNIDLIPSWKTVDERLQNAPWHTVDGVHYGVPYQWGPNVLAYNTDVFKEAPKSWSVVFKEQTLPDGKSNKGRVQAPPVPAKGRLSPTVARVGRGPVGRQFASRIASHCPRNLDVNLWKVVRPERGEARDPSG